MCASKTLLFESANVQLLMLIYSKYANKLFNKKLIQKSYNRNKISFSLHNTLVVIMLKRFQMDPAYVERW